MIKKEQGFSMLELVVTLGVTMILSSLALPSFSDWNHSLQRATARDLIKFDIRRGKTEAIARGAIGVFELNGDGSGYVYGVDRLPYSDPPAIEEIVFSRTLPDGISMGLTQNIMFDSRGLLIDELRDPTSVIFTMNQDSMTFSTAEIYTIGRICYDTGCYE